MSIQARFQLSHPGFDLDVDLELPSTAVTVLFGRSGCGKTSVLRCMAGLSRSARGRLSVDGQVWQDEHMFLAPYQRPVGYVFQEASLFQHLDVRRNLAYGWSRRAPQERRVAWSRTVELLGIGHLLARMPPGLSGGECQRVAIARALLASPRLLLMDEPLAALDQARKNEFLPWLERLHAELDMPVVYVSHAPDEVARLADHLVVMEAGRVVAAGSLTQTLARLDLPIRHGEDAGVVLHGQVVQRDEQWQLARVAIAGGSLWVRDGGQAIGQSARVRILARDVSIARAPASDSSILNSVAATVVELAGDDHPALAKARLDFGGSPLLARLTRRSADSLGLAPGMPCGRRSRRSPWWVDRQARPASNSDS
jgi:molybdate transport system ATP-binding protein